MAGRGIDCCLMVGALRLAWSVVEDEMLRALVCLHGCRWDAVAAGLVGPQQLR